MASPPENHAWFAQAPIDIVLDSADNLSEFERLWRGFMTARVTLGLVLMVMQAGLWSMGQTGNATLVFICSAYFVAALAVRLFAKPRFLGRSFDPQWLLTVGVDVVVFSALHFMQSGSINYAPLMALPILLASVLGSLFLAMGTAAAVALLLLAHSSWQALQMAGESSSQFAQSALTGAGCFVLAFLSNQLSARLALQEQRSRQSQEAVQVQRQVNELVIESLTDGILVVDAKGHVRAANPAARQLLGSESPLRETSFDLGSESAWSALGELASLSFVRTDLRSTDISIRHSGQGLRRLRVRTRLTSPQGGAKESLCVMFLQDQREMEARMRTEKLASMGRMSAAVAHEIRNPLAAITQANALLDEDTTDPKHKQLTQMVMQNANRLGKIVDEVLNISRVPARDQNAPAPSLALSDCVGRICRDWALQTNSVDLLRTRLAESEMHVAFEPEHLRRVLVNLLDNARRYALGLGESIQVSVTQNTVGQSVMRVWSDGMPLEQSVERHLFEPFFSSESRSSGLGLYICRELCEGHGASIIYHRTLGQMAGQGVHGNEFFITFRTARSADRVHP
jgi:two-component system, NtrC family, sensor histidine kinase PilS